MHPFSLKKLVLIVIIVGYSPPGHRESRDEIQKWYVIYEEPNPENYPAHATPSKRPLNPVEWIFKEDYYFVEVVKHLPGEPRVHPHAHKELKGCTEYPKESREVRHPEQHFNRVIALR